MNLTMDEICMGCDHEGDCEDYEEVAAINRMIGIDKCKYYSEAEKVVSPCTLCTETKCRSHPDYAPF